MGAENSWNLFANKICYSVLFIEELNLSILKVIIKNFALIPDILLIWWCILRYFLINCPVLLISSLYTLGCVYSSLQTVEFLLVFSVNLT